MTHSDGRTGNRNRRNRGRKPTKKEPRMQKQTQVLDQQGWRGWKPTKDWKPTIPVRKACSHIGQRFELDRGLFILASSYKDTTGRHAETQRDLGFYLDDDWAQRSPTAVLVSPGVDFPRPEAVPVVMYPWPDYGMPLVSLRGFDQAIEWVFNKIRHGEVVETGCYGGHGRTGTLLACMLVKQGTEAQDAIDRVRLLYCDWAIEGNQQEHFVLQYHAYVNGHAIPAMPKINWETVMGAKVSTPLSPTTVRASDDDEYEAWLRLNGGQETVAQRWSESVTSAVVDADVDLPEDWEFMSDEELERYLDLAGYSMVETVSDDAMTCAEAPCPHPQACNEGVGECLREWLSSARGELS